MSPYRFKTNPTEWQRSAGQHSGALLLWEHRIIFGGFQELFGTPPGSPRSDKMISTAVQWSERIMAKLTEIEDRPEGMQARQGARGTVKQG